MDCLGGYPPYIFAISVVEKVGMSSCITPNDTYVLVSGAVEKHHDCTEVGVFFSLWDILCLRRAGRHVG